jgi:hypothetical protein
VGPELYIQCPVNLTLSLRLIFSRHNDKVYGLMDKHDIPL